MKPYKGNIKSNHPLYQTWMSMFARCYNKNHIHYKYYGACGITVCASWFDFSCFINSMGNRPKETTLDRINNTLGYSPENCRWATKKQQAQNKGKRKTNTTGITGVQYEKHFHYYRVVVTDFITKKSKSLYSGKDFFEACCIRKSWESKL